MGYEITLTQSTTNQVAIRGCSEPNNFTWQIENVDHNVNVVFYTEDYSDAPNYYNSFDITLSSTHSGLTSGIIDLNEGTYLYNVYQMQEPYELDITKAIQLVETGLVFVNKKTI